MSNIYNTTSLLVEISCTAHKWIVYVSWGDWISKEQATRAAPTIDMNARYYDYHAIIICETEQDARHHFDRIVGDDGPTAYNDFNLHDEGCGGIYAMIISPTSGVITENT